LSASKSRRVLEAFCENLAEIDDALVRRHTSAWHKALICSSEQFPLRVEGLEQGEDRVFLDSLIASTAPRWLGGE
jgi:hypothetical protein